MPDPEAVAMSIGAVTKATGISTHTLRKWESRYGVIEPLRTPTGRRVYSQAQVERLVLLRDLVARGHQIGRLSTLSDEELQALARAAPARESAPAFDRVTVVGPVISAVLSREQLGPAPFRLVTRPAADWLADGEEGSEELSQALVVELPTLRGELCAKLVELAREAYERVIVVYGFANRATLRMLLDAGIVCLKSPVGGQEVLRALAQAEAPGVVAALADPTIPAPRFSADSIARLAAMAPSVRCECRTTSLRYSPISAPSRSTACCASRATRPTGLCTPGSGSSQPTPGHCSRRPWKMWPGRKDWSSKKSKTSRADVQPAGALPSKLMLLISA